jgi:hypothetical protein
MKAPLLVDLSREPMPRKRVWNFAKRKGQAWIVGLFSVLID